jgi:hypothetical protein
MLHESIHATAEAAESGRARQVQEEAAFLRHAAFETARGLYEAGTAGGKGSKRMRGEGSRTVEQWALRQPSWPPSTCIIRSAASIFETRR